MTTFQDLQAEHEALLSQRDAPTDAAQFVAAVQQYIERVCAEAAHIPAPRERDQLRAILRFWASYVYDKTGTYPNTTLRPATSREASVPPTKPSTPTPISSPPHRTPIVWGIAALAVLAIIVAIFALAASRAASPAAGSTTQPSQPDRVATQVIEQMMVNATMTKVVEDRSTPTPVPTATPTSTPTAVPTDTPTPLPTPTATPVLVLPTLIPAASGGVVATPAGVLPSTLIPPTVEVVAPSEAIPLDVGYQILTQGPSPFDPAVWVIQLKLVGIGGNGVYIYWVNGLQLPGDEYTVQGTSCEPQTLTIGVTSSGEAVKHDISLLSPLVKCFEAGPQ